MKYSIYRLQPDRRFMKSSDSLDEAKEFAQAQRTPQGEDGFEVWDTEAMRPVFHTKRGQDTEVFS
jgi:hypothetical protein